jgi:hypothetical protein
VVPELLLVPFLVGDMVYLLWLIICAIDCFPIILVILILVVAIELLDFNSLSAMDGHDHPLLN